MGGVDAVAVASAEEIHEKDSTALGDEAVSEVVEGYTWCADAVEEEDFTTCIGTEFVDSYGSIL